MDVAYLGVSHWHRNLWGSPLVGHQEHRIVAVADPDRATAATVAESFGCDRSYEDYVELLDETRPEFVFVLGSHAEMPNVVRTLLERNIPCLVEKPCGRTRAEVAELAAACASALGFVSVGLVYRIGEFYATLRDRLPAADVDYATFRFLAGPQDRYLSNGSAWMLEKDVAGGGVLMNLGAHFVDLVLGLGLFGIQDVSQLRVEYADVRRLRDVGDVEDYAHLAISGPKGFGTIDVGYQLPAGNGVFDLLYALRGPAGYARSTQSDLLTIRDAAGDVDELSISTTNASCYGAFIADMFARVQQGKPPLVGLTEMVAVMDVIEEAYRISDAVSVR